MKKDFMVLLSAAVTLCGRIGPMPVAAAADRARLCELRRRTGASLMGGGSLRTDDPVMLAGDESDSRRVRSFVSMSGNLPVEGRRIFAAGAPPVVFTCAAAAPGLARRLAGRAEVVAAPSVGGLLDLGTVLTQLHQRSGGDILIEGGGGMNHAALAQGVVDEIHLSLAPRFSGDPDAPLFVHGGASLGDPFVEFTLVDFRPSVDGDLFLVYKRMEP